MWHFAHFNRHILNPIQRFVIEKRCLTNPLILIVFGNFVASNKVALTLILIRIFSKLAVVYDT